MKVKTLKLCGALAASTLALTAQADPIPQWANSYSADNRCYCVSGLDAGLAGSIVPTPVGGQSVGQICERIGTGPKLTLSNGEFNHPVYTDAQCGNGPKSSVSSNGPEGCEGSMTEDGSVCLGTGPTWDLKTAYAKPAASPSLTTAVAVETQVIESNTPVITAVESDESQLPLATVVESKIVASTPDVTVVSEKVVESEVVYAETTSNSGVTVVSERVIGPSESTSVASQDTSSVITPSPTNEKSDVQEPVDEKTRARLLAAELVAEKEEERKLGSVRTPAVVETIIADPTGVETEVANASVIQESETQTPVVIETPPETASILVEDESTKEAAAVVTAAGDGPDSTASATAVKVPFPDYGTPSYSHDYVQIAPIGYDFGGSGAALVGSVAATSRFNFVGKAAVAEDYSEYMLGVSTGFAPAILRGATIVLLAGVEHGVFDLGSTTLGKTELDDTGGVVEGSVGYNLTPKLHLQGGVSYSSFLEGDPSVFGLFLLRMTNNLDLAGRAEGGDNDNFSVGLRFNY